MEKNILSPPAAAKLVISNKKGVPVNLYDKDRNLVLRFKSSVQLSEFLGCHKSTVGDYLKSGKLYKNMYYIKKE